MSEEEEKNTENFSNNEEEGEEEGEESNNFSINILNELRNTLTTNMFNNLLNNYNIDTDFDINEFIFSPTNRSNESDSIDESKSNNESINREYNFDDIDFDINEFIFSPYSVVTGRSINGTNMFNSITRTRPRQRTLSSQNPLSIVYSYSQYIFSDDHESSRILDEVINESFNEQPTLEKTNKPMEFEVSKYKSIELEDKSKECSVCLMEFENESDVAIISCNHLFHKECIKEWTQYKTSCPVCRKKFC